MTFTVKHRESEAAGGREFLTTCEKIEVVFPGLATEKQQTTEQSPNWDQCGIFLDPEHLSTEPNQPMIRYSRDIILFGGEETESAKRRKGGKVWVMNEQGATVATYDL